MNINKTMRWGNGLVDWIDGDVAFVSVVFSWKLEKARQRIIQLKSMGYKVKAGGPAVTLNPSMVSDIAELDGSVNALPHHNPDATFTTRGCIRKCGFCAVPRIEGQLIELNDDQWQPKPIICDNNILAASIKHFDHVIDRLLDAQIIKVDFNQGLDARLLTEHHAERLHELPKAIIRLAWDNVKTEKLFIEAFNKLINAKINPEFIRVYVLIGYDDTPEDALYRVRTIRNMGAYPFPMRYQPLNAKKKNEYISPNWNHRLLADYVRYWSNLKILRNIPFEKYDYRMSNKTYRKQHEN